MENYPKKLISEVNKYLEENEEAKVFHYDVYTTTPYIDKSITSTTYRVYILYNNLFKVMRFRICSNSNWSDKEVSSDSMIAWEIKMCYEKSDFIRKDNK